jgi:GMP synthase-like glutamine amidotransferase
MRVHVLQHLPFEDLGNIAPILKARGAQVSYTHFFENPQLPPPDGFDLIIIMGGSMSANDEQQLPWLKLEKQFIRDAIGRDIAVLGVCLGAQLIANALGARVFRNPHKEIGWFPIRRVPAPDGHFSLPQECTAFHWHGETFDLPEGSVKLAESDACANQAFQIKRNVIGLQFHLETTHYNAHALVDNFRDELVQAPYIQSEDEIRSAPASLYQAIESITGDLLTYLLEVPASRRHSKL